MRRRNRRPCREFCTASPVALAWPFPTAIIGTLLFVAGGAALVGYDALLWRFHAAPLSLVSLLVVFAAATCSSIAGFAFSALCGAILFHTLRPPVMAVEIMLVCSIAIQSLSVLALRNEIEWRSLLQFVAGGLIGLPIGIYALLNLPKGMYESVFGALLIAYGGRRCGYGLMAGAGTSPSEPLAASRAAWPPSPEHSSRSGAALKAGTSPVSVASTSRLFWSCRS